MFSVYVMIIRNHLINNDKTFFVMFSILLAHARINRKKVHKS